ncbi:MAG: cache domain-containing protein, partial [Anaerolineae bacterium]
MLIFLILLGALSFRAGRTSLRREVNRRDSHLATLVAKDINAQFDNIWGNVRLFTYQLETSADLLPIQTHAMLELRRAAPLTYRALYLFDDEGQLLIHLADPLGDLMAIQDVTEIIERPPIPLTAEISTAYEAARNGDLYLSNTTIVGADQVLVIYMGIPAVVRQGRSSQIVVAEIDLRDIWRRIDEIHIGQTGRAFVVSPEGTIIAHPDRSYIGRPLAPELSQVLDGYMGQAESTDPTSGARLLASYSPVGGQSGWGVVVEQERDEALAPVNRIATATISVLVIAMGMATIITVLVAQSIIYPLQRLEETTWTIAHTGDLSQNVTVEGQDEVGQLA